MSRAPSRVERRVTLVTGGARSGKSRHALELAARRPRPAFVATAEAFDDEMAERIRRHRCEREAGATAFTTVEAPRDPAAALDALPEGCGAAVVDCLTIWLTNLMVAAGEERPSADPGSYPEIGRLLERLATPPCELIVVTNEVGWGLVPTTPLGRAFRDLAGTVNQEVAARAGRVVLMVSGLPLVVRQGSGDGGGDG